MHFPSNIRKRTWSILDRYGILLASGLILVYYLWSAVSLFGSSHPPRTFQGYFFQFDSLIVLWLLLVAVAKLYEYRKKHKEEEEKNKRIVMEHEKQKMRLGLLDDVTAHLTDAINNPLSIISLSAGSLRDKFSADLEVTAFLDRIEGALGRLREVLVDFQNYQTRKIMKSTDGLVVSPAPAKPSSVQEAPGTSAA
jgi:signal transduction histidine kinase